MTRSAPTKAAAPAKSRVPFKRPKNIGARGHGGNPNAALLTITEAAGFLSIGMTLVWGLIKRGELESLSVGKRRLITRTSLDAFIERRLEAMRELRAKKKSRNPVRRNPEAAPVATARAGA